MDLYTDFVLILVHHDLFRRILRWFFLLFAARVCGVDVQIDHEDGAHVEEDVRYQKEKPHM